MDRLDGEFIITNEFTVSGEKVNKAPFPLDYACSDGSGTLIMNMLRVNKRACFRLPSAPAKTIFGPGGIIRGLGYVHVDKGTYEIGSYANWTMYYNNLGNYSTACYAFYKDNTPDEWSDLVFDTTDWYDRTTGRTITCEAPICASDVDSAAKLRVTVKGCGTFLFANKADDPETVDIDDADGGKWFTGGLVVTNGATVAVKPGCRPGKGVVSIHKGSTLKVPLSDTVSIENELNLNDGAKLGFHFTKQDVLPVLALNPENVKFSEGSSKILYVKISADSGIVPGKGDKVLTSGGAFKGVKVMRTRDSDSWAGRVEVNEDGDIVLKDKVYFNISIR